MNSIKRFATFWVHPKPLCSLAYRGHEHEILRNLVVQSIFLIAVAAGAGDAWGVPAAPFVHRLRQPTGETFSARQWGDEFQSGWETESGYTILLDQERSFWAYAELDRKGGLIGSRHKVARDNPLTAAKGLRPTKRHGLSRRTVPFAGSPAPSVTTTGKTDGTGPLFGNTPLVTRNIPVILVNFSDTSPTYSAADFATLLFSSGNWSFKDFYEEVSRGAFTVTPGPSGVQGWFTASGTHDYYGQRSGWGPPDKWPGDLVYEAVSQADPAVDF
jgi:immune inhibitor A